MIADFHEPEYRFLSNFYPSPIVFDGWMWPTVEHAYQAQKTDDIQIRAKILRQESPADAKRLGRHYKMRKDWDQVKVVIMRELLRLKFPVGGMLSDELLDTYPQDLIEGNDWHDQFWGTCNCPEHIDTYGENQLGISLMLRRHELQHFQRAK